MSFKFNFIFVEVLYSMATKYCNCHNCKHPYDHLTFYHTCGHINKVYESNYIKTSIANDSVPQYNLKLKFTEISKEKHCNVPSCKSKHTHSTLSHKPFFSQDMYGGSNGPDMYGITARREEITKKSRLINDFPNTYIAMYWGMGIMIIFRNVNSKIEKLETENDYSHFVKGLRQIKEPVVKYY